MVHVLQIGHRRELTKALERAHIPYTIWHPVPLLNKTAAKRVIIQRFPTDVQECLLACNKKAGITHVIAGTEAAVLPSTVIRDALSLRGHSRETILRCQDKVRMKEFLRPLGIPMTDFATIPTPMSTRDAKDLFERMGRPLFLKRRFGSGGRGIVRARNEEELQALASPHVYTEREVIGQEGSIESFVAQGKIVFTNITDYFRLQTCNLLPAPYAPIEQQTILELNQNVITHLGIQHGITHLEYYRTQQGLVFGEIALRPPGGHIMDALNLAYDFDPWDAFVRVELGRKPSFPKKAARYAASYILHPGAGMLVAVAGEELVRTALPSLKTLKIKIKPGDYVTQRAAVGEDVGYALFAHESLDTLKTDLLTFSQTLHFELC